MNWDSFKYRNYQPDIGRFFNVDPLAAKYVYNSPYAFSENKVTAHVELEGLESWSIKNLNVQALQSNSVRQNVTSAAQNGANIVKIDGGVQAAGIGGGFKAGPLQASASLQVGKLSTSITPSGMTVQGSLVSVQAGVKAPGTDVGGNLNLGAAKANITPQGNVTGNASLVSGDAKAQLPGLPGTGGGGATGQLPDNVTASHSYGENGSQTVSASTNGDVGVSAVVGNVWASITVNVQSALGFLNNAVNAVGAYLGETTKQQMDPVSAGDKAQVGLH